MDNSGTYTEFGLTGYAFGPRLTGPDSGRKEHEVANGDLMQRHRELSALAAVAQAISTEQLDLAGTLERALNVVLEVTGLSAGWVFLLPEGGGDPVLASSARLPRHTVEELAKPRPPDCECRQVIISRRPLVVRPLHENCPLGTLALSDGRLASGHATVPLLTRSEVVGVLNVADVAEVSFSEQELTLLSAIGRQLGIAIENARLWEALQQRDMLRGQLLEQAMIAQEEERKRIARELHDQIGQALTSILLGLRALESEVGGSGELTVSPARLQDLNTIVADTLDGVRDLALELRPSVLDDLGLVPALQRHVRIFGARHQLAIDFQTVGLDGVRLPPPVETSLYRIVQEALINVIQHAGANRVSLLLEGRTRAVVAIVEDDGSGFEVERPSRGPAERYWLGLHGMRERAELLGGTLTIESVPGSGTTVFVEVPLRSGQDGHGE